MPTPPVCCHPTDIPGTNAMFIPGLSVASMKCSLSVGVSTARRESRGCAQAALPVCLLLLPAQSSTRALPGKRPGLWERPGGLTPRRETDSDRDISIPAGLAPLSIPAGLAPAAPLQQSRCLHNPASQGTEPWACIKTNSSVCQHRAELTCVTTPALSRRDLPRAGSPS